MLLADRGFGRASLLRFLQQMPQHTGQTVDYVGQVKGNVHIQTTDGYCGLLRKYPLRKRRYVLLLGVRYRSDGAAVMNLVLYWGKGHREVWYLATSLGDAKLSVDNYRQRMQPEQYFRDGKQYCALDGAKVTTPERLQRLLVGLLPAGLQVPWRFRWQVCSWGKLGLRQREMEYYLVTLAPPPGWLGRPPESGYA